MDNNIKQKIDELVNEISAINEDEKHIDNDSHNV